MMEIMYILRDVQYFSSHSYEGVADGASGNKIAVCLECIENTEEEVWTNKLRPPEYKVRSWNLIQ